MNWIKCKFAAILKRHCYHSKTDETLYLLTVFDVLKVVLRLTLVSFFSMKYPWTRFEVETCIYPHFL